MQKFNKNKNKNKNERVVIAIAQLLGKNHAPTKLALREGHDVINSPFVGSSGQHNRLVLRAGEYAGTTSDPILEITYTVPSAPSSVAIQDLNYSWISKVKGDMLL